MCLAIPVEIQSNELQFGGAVKNGKDYFWRHHQKGSLEMVPVQIVGNVNEEEATIKYLAIEEKPGELL